MAGEFDIRRIEVIDDETTEMYRRMSPQQRVRLGLGQFEFAKRTMQAGVRERHPDWSEQEIQQEVLWSLRRAAG